MRLSEAGMFLAEKSQELRGVPVLGPAYRLIRRELVGSRSSAWAEPNYYRVRAVTTSLGNAPLTALADPEAKLHRKDHERAVIIGVGRAAIDALMRSHKEERPQHAVAYWDSNNVIRGGVLDEGFGYYFPDEPDEGPPLYAAAMRQGQNPFGIAAGVFLPEERKLVVPRSVTIIAQGVQVQTLPSRYQGIPLS